MAARSHPPARPCAEPGCHLLVRGAARCPQHQLSYPDHRAKPSTSRGYDAHWRRLVRIAIARSPVCSRCGSIAHLTGDHIIPLSKGGTSTLENIWVLCRSCNSRKGNR